MEIILEFYFGRCVYMQSQVIFALIGTLVIGVLYAFGMEQNVIENMTPTSYLFSDNYAQIRF